MWGLQNIFAKKNEAKFKKRISNVLRNYLTDNTIQRFETLKVLPITTNFSEKISEDYKRGLQSKFCDIYHVDFSADIFQLKAINVGNVGFIHNLH